MIQKILAGLFLIFAIFLTSSQLSSSHWLKVYRKVCTTVGTQYYDDSSEIRKWTTSCLENGHEVVDQCRSQQNVRLCLATALNRQMERLGVSHLFVSTPVETDELLFHTSFDTGIRTRLIEDIFVVIEIKPKSAAAHTELKVGDIIKSRNGSEMRYATESRQSGRFEIEREGRTFVLNIEGEFFQEDVRPFLTKYSPSFGVLRIPSFEGDYKGVPLFQEDEWKKIVEEMTGLQHVVLDLRDNLGGNFVAMLRAASPFFCKPTSLGSIVQPRAIEKDAFEFPNQLAAEFQVSLLEEYGRIQLVTYSGYPCYTGQLTVLIDHNTASVAEILAQGLRVRTHTKIQGHPTSGSVLVARRSEISELGYGYTLSIPVAEYQSTQGLLRESFGIQPDELLFYDREDALDGIDSWIETVRSKRNFKSK